MVKEKKIVIKYWKNLQNAPEIFLKLKTICSLNDKLEYAITALKTYCTIIANYYTIKFPAMPPLLAEGNFLQILIRKLISLTVS